jgi:hypothetical protein
MDSCARACTEFGLVLRTLRALGYGIDAYPVAAEVDLDSLLDSYRGQDA